MTVGILVVIGAVDRARRARRSGRGRTPAGRSRFEWLHGLGLFAAVVAAGVAVVRRPAHGDRAHRRGPSPDAGRRLGARHRCSSPSPSSPIVVATVRALRRGWVAAGDNGLLLLRTQDVGTSNHPLLGTWTSASLTAGRSINNPGPLWFDVLAPFVRIAGPSVGLAVGVMVANVAADRRSPAWAARRAGGQTAMVLVTALSAGLAWSMGSELLFDAWQPHAMILPFWAFLVMVWALSCGDVALLPWIVGLASLIVQTHLSFVYVVAVVGAAGVGRRAWSSIRRDADGRPAPGRRRGAAWRRSIVAVVAWIQPVLDQIVGEGNLGALLRSSGGDADRIGLRLGARLVASVVACPRGGAGPASATRSGRPGIVRPAVRATWPRVTSSACPPPSSGCSSSSLVLAPVIAVGLAPPLVDRGRRRRWPPSPSPPRSCRWCCRRSASSGSARTRCAGCGRSSPLVVLAPLLALGGWEPARRP